MKMIALDAGIEEFAIAGGGVLRFNPSDPNLYARFLAAQEQLEALEAELQQSLSGEDSPKGLVELTVRADRQVKDLLDQVFGCGNDFDKALGGVNLLAVTKTGERVAEKLFRALEEILSEGAARFAEEKAAALRESL